MLEMSEALLIILYWKFVKIAKTDPFVAIRRYLNRRLYGNARKPRNFYPPSKSTGHLRWNRQSAFHRSPPALRRRFDRKWRRSATRSHRTTASSTLGPPHRDMLLQGISSPRRQTEGRDQLYQRGGCPRRTAIILFESMDTNISPFLVRSTY